jgi:predicted ATP-binding protein involved in virulence
MAEDDVKDLKQQQGKTSLLDQVEAELDKSARESLKSKLKDLVKKRKDAEKQVALINLEITKAIEDYENGL